MNNPPDNDGALEYMLSSASKIIQNSSTVHDNLSQNIIFTTEDKIRLCLIEHLSILEKKNSWIAPFGILLTISIIFPTTNFKEFIFLSADTWEAIYIISCGLSLIWLLTSLKHTFKSTSIDDLIKKIKSYGIITDNDALKDRTWYYLEKKD